MSITCEVTRCLRCGKLCAASAPGNPDARLMRRARVGYCADCAATQFLQTTPVLTDLLAELGPAVLLSEVTQAQFARILETGNADCPMGKINWQRVVDQWPLPFPDSRSRV